MGSGTGSRPEGGESLADGEFHAQAAFIKQAEKSPEKSVVIVSHGDRSAALLRICSEYPDSQRGCVSQDVPTGSVNELILTITGWHTIEEGGQSFE